LAENILLDPLPAEWLLKVQGLQILHFHLQYRRNPWVSSQQAVVLLPAGSPGDPCLGTNSSQQGYAVGDVAEAVLHSSLGTFSHVNCSLHYCASHNEQPGFTTPNLK
jgi:hypothetical protein